ncbi:MAG: ADP-ribosylglycohydrolase family protein [Anaerolineaceae bacterium]|nr:ADP-ribosylglycohydrolase family protein [Anaerolineaceae bacterium]
MIKKNDISLESRAIGCLAGLAIGDAFGDIARKDEYRIQYGIIDDLYEGAKSTDDTEFAVLTAKTIVDSDGKLDTETILAAWERYIISQGGVFDRGGRPLRGAVNNLQKGLRPPFSGKYNALNNDDGAAMRIAPIGILCAGNPQLAASFARKDAEVSHFEDGVYAAQAVAASVSLAMVNAPVEEVFRVAGDYIPSDTWLGFSMEKANRICKQHHSIESAWSLLHTEFWNPERSLSPEAIPQAYCVFKLTQGNFKQCIFWGGNFGRDADTICAIVGALSGALSGIGSIPNTWVEKTKTPSGICLRFSKDENVVDLAKEVIQIGIRNGYVKGGR